jgi:hypothetical protein
MDHRNRQLARTLSKHDALITRYQAKALGLSAAEIHGYLARGTLQRVHRNVYRAPAAPETPRQRLRAACLATGTAGVASHTSAAWMWNMIDRAPDTPEISVNSSSLPLLKGVRVHRSRDLDHARTILRTGIPTTDPLRTLVDLGTVMAAPDLTDVLHRTLTTRLLTLQAVVAELNRLSRQGRPGVKRLRGVLTACGLAAAPHPSVLESMMLRLIIDHALPVPVIEMTAGPNGEYRLDFAYPLIKLAIEVDGYIWHFTPEQLRRDHRRRNRLVADGWQTLVFTWMDVTQRPHEVAAEIRAAMHRLGAPIVRA